ncbi:hypothetical protein VNI00_016232, partial [Paramarasmius palmivorus]
LTYAAPNEIQDEDFEIPEDPDISEHVREQCRAQIITLLKTMNNCQHDKHCECSDNMRSNLVSAFHCVVAADEDLKPKAQEAFDGGIADYAKECKENGKHVQKEWFKDSEEGEVWVFWDWCWSVWLQLLGWIQL